jgi:hypothetical protein
MPAPTITVKAVPGGYTYTGSEVQWNRILA